MQMLSHQARTWHVSVYVYPIILLQVKRYDQVISLWVGFPYHALPFRKVAVNSILGRIPEVLPGPSLVKLELLYRQVKIKSLYEKDKFRKTKAKNIISFRDRTRAASKLVAGTWKKTYQQENNVNMAFKNGRSGDDWFINFCRRNRKKKVWASSDPFIIYSFYDRVEKCINNPNIISEQI